VLMYEGKIIIIIRHASHSIKKMRFSKLRVNVVDHVRSALGYVYGKGKKTVGIGIIFRYLLRMAQRLL